VCVAVTANVAYRGYMAFGVKRDGSIQQWLGNVSLVVMTWLASTLGWRGTTMSW